MSVYKKLTLRIAILAVLVMGTFVASKAGTARTSCLSECIVQDRACIASCDALPHKPSEGCPDFCLPELQACEADCS
jgi:hypothetical protein